MTARHGTKGKNRRRMAVLGGAVGAFAAAAAMATGSAVTAAPAKADFEDLLDPIIQPLITSLSDALVGFDPAAAADLTTWTDSLLASLNSLDIGAALPASAEPAAAAAAASPAASGPFDIPITMQEVTEPTVQATVGGADTTLLVDTGSSGLVVPYTDFGSNIFTQIENILALGTPTGIDTSGYSGGVDYVYLTYNDVPTVYGNGVLDTTGPVDVEIYSWDPSNPFSYFTNDAFQNFDTSNMVTGVLGIGNGVGPDDVSPLQGFGGVLVDIPDGKLIVDNANPGEAIATLTGGIVANGHGVPIVDLYESVNGGTPVAVSDDVDSGGVYGTIPSSLVGSSGSLPSGTVISVYDNAAGTGTPVYTYVVGTDSLGQSTAPVPTTGNSIDSGVIPFLQSPIYISYTDNTLTFDAPNSIS
jgi:hypothetical protein